MLEHRDSSLSKGSEIPKATEKKLQDHARRLSEQCNLKVGPSPTNYHQHMEKVKTDKCYIAVRDSWVRYANKIDQKYKEDVKNVRGNSQQEIFAEQIKLAQNRKDQQDKLYKLSKDLPEDLRRSEEK
jgi:hypothetical protein